MDIMRIKHIPFTGNAKYPGKIITLSFSAMPTVLTSATLPWTVFACCSWILMKIPISMFVNLFVLFETILHISNSLDDDDDDCGDDCGDWRNCAVVSYYSHKFYEELRANWIVLKSYFVTSVVYNQIRRVNEKLPWAAYDHNMKSNTCARIITLELW